MRGEPFRDGELPYGNLPLERPSSDLSAQQSLIDDLEAVIVRHDIGRRAQVLRRVTDLFVSGSANFSRQEVALFDDVMRRLLSEIDATARAAFGQRLRAIRNAPPGVIRTLALDDAIEVARTFLAESEQVDEDTLVEGARTKSQEHLLAISRRKVLTEAVTDVLVQRGNDDVTLSTAGNPGAQFSEAGYATLVRRSQENDDLAVCLWSRPEIPRPHLLKLFAEASETIRAKLVASNARKAQLLDNIIAHASDRIQASARERNPAFELARQEVENLDAAGALDESCLEALAIAGRFDEVTVALSIMCDLPIGAIERTMVQQDCDHLLLLAKAIGLSWNTTKALLLLQSRPHSPSASESEQSLAKFTKLQARTARKAIEFYRMRELAATALRDESCVPTTG